MPSSRPAASTSIPPTSTRVRKRPRRLRSATDTPRESYYLADKLNGSDFAAKSEEEAKNEIRVSLERTGAGYIDFYLLHGIDEGNIGNFNRYGIWDYMKELKAEGLIRHYGFSFHSTPEHLEQLLTDHPDVEFVQLQINYADWEDPLIC